MEQLTDHDIVALVRAGDVDSLIRAMNAVLEIPGLWRSIKWRCGDCAAKLWSRLSRGQALGNDFAKERSAGEEQLASDAEVRVFEEVLSIQALPRTILERGGGFDSTRGTLRAWLLRQVSFQLRDWQKAQDKHLPQMSSEPVEPAAQPRFAFTRHARETMRTAFANLSETRRAVMIVQYLDDTDAWLQPDDYACLRRVREKIRQRKAKNSNSAQTEVISEQELAILRDEYRRLWQSVAQRALDVSAAVYERELDDKVRSLHIQLRLYTEKYAMLRRRLENNRYSEHRLQALEQRARTQTQETISKQYSDWTERSFASTVRRLAVVGRQLAAARMQLANSDPTARPTISQIAAFLRLTENAVSTALSRAHRDLLQAKIPLPTDDDMDPLFFDDDDARPDDLDSYR